jgi:DNA repair exonuclease SbcCD nuclease subunit
MKIAILNDTHWGARNDNPIFLEHFMKFFEEEFFPYLDKHGIRHIIHLGDLMDRRKYVNFNTLNLVRNRFIKAIWDRNIRVDIIPGNHDVYYKNTNEVNSLEELFSGYGQCDGWNFWHEPVAMKEIGISLVPWITKENEKQCLDFIASKPTPVLMGHFELSGYEVLRGVEHHDGMSPDLMSGYEAVYSGHFHCKHSKGNVHYLGTQYQITFSDLNETKGFHVFDTETRQMEYVQNPHRIFTKLVYNDETTDYTCPFLNLKEYTNTFVKVIVEKKTKPVVFDQLLDRLNEFRCHSYSIDERVTHDKTKSDHKVDLTKDTLTLICEEIDGMEGVNDTAHLKNLIRDLYMEALQV